MDDMLCAFVLETVYKKGVLQIKEILVISRCVSKIFLRLKSWTHGSKGAVTQIFLID